MTVLQVQSLPVLANQHRPKPFSFLSIFGHDVCMDTRSYVFGWSSVQSFWAKDGSRESSMRDQPVRQVDTNGSPFASILETSAVGLDRELVQGSEISKSVDCRLAQLVT
jgi:hypothetical protein